VAALIAVTYSFVVTIIIGLAIKKTMGLRTSEEVEVSGVDLAIHGETAYETIGSRATMEVNA